MNWLNYMFAIFSYCILSEQHQLKTKKINWLNELTKHLNQNSRVYQATCIFNNINNLSFPSDEIIQTFGRNNKLPIYNYYNLEGKNYPVIGYRSTTLFIIIDDLSDNYKFLMKATKKISQLSANRIRPKCLIISLREKKSKYQKIFEYMWSKQYLDVTIIQVLKKRNGKRLSQLQEEETPTIHSFNPFRKIYIKKKFPSRLCNDNLFPSKLHNLYGYKISVSMFHRAPFINVKKNSTGHVLEASGSEFTVAKFLAQTMRFEMEILPTLDEDLRQYSCSLRNSTGILRKLMNNEIQFSVTTGSNFLICQGSLLESTFTTRQESLIATVPIEFVDTFALENGFQFAIGIGLILLFFVVMKIVIEFMKLNWEILEIFRAVLSGTIPVMPEKLAERILFGCILIVSIIYASNIYESLIDISFRTVREVEFFNLSELTNFKPIIHPLIYTLFYNTSSPSAKKFLRNVERRSITEEQCVNLLIKHKNYSCVMYLPTAKILIEKTRDNCEKQKMRVVSEALSKTQRGILMEKNSPYVDRFNEILIRMKEAGLMIKWDKDILARKIPKSEDLDPCTQKKQVATVELHQIFIVVGIGYGISVLVFFGELIVHRFHSWMNCCKLRKMSRIANKTEVRLFY